MKTNESKIFGIGLSKTGTTSLARALEILGYRTRDYLGVTRYVSGDLSSVDLQAIDSADAFTDTPIPSFYRELDAAYPGSRFILTVREQEGWLKSCAKQFNQKHADNQNEATRQVFVDLYGTNVFDEEKFKAGYDRFIAGVTEYFKDRPQDLLIFDITAGDGWEQLCPFLGKSIPDAPFPRANVTRIRWMDINQLVAAVQVAGEELHGSIKFLEKEAQGELSFAQRLALAFRGGAWRVGAKAAKRARRTILDKLEVLNPEIPVISSDRPTPPYEERRNWNHFWLVDFIDEEEDLLRHEEPAALSIALIEDRRPIIGVVCIPRTGTIWYVPHGKPAQVLERKRETRPLALEPSAGKCKQLTTCLAHNTLPHSAATYEETLEWQTAASHAILAASSCSFRLQDSGEPLWYNKEQMENPPFRVECGDKQKQ